MKRRLKLSILCFVLSIGVAIGQTSVVNGLIVDESGEPIIGASVTLKGTTVAVLTDTDGKFTINIPSKKSTLVFTFIGYEKQELEATNNMRVVLKSTDNSLTEVVVTGMTKIDKRLFTGATNRLSADDVKIDGLSEVSRGLEGRAAGVSVQNVSGTFGTAPKIRVRGATSIYGSSKPLWVVDGVIMEDAIEVSADALSSGDAETMISSAISGLNADDIESFQILKDGSATSIYGARAMAGVIVVTTKKGKAGVNKINYTGEFTMRLKPSYSEFNIMNSQEQMGVYKTLSEKGWLNFAETFRASEGGVYGKMYQLINTYDPTTGQYAVANTPEGRNAYLRQAEMRNTDWFDELFETNIMQNHSVSISSGTEKTSAYVSLSALLDPGWSKQSSVKRYTGNANITHRILPNLSINMISNASYRKQKAPGTLSQDVDVVNGQVKRDFDINPYSYALNSSRALDPNTFYTRNYAPFNILHELENNYMDLNVTDLRMQAELKWSVIPELELSVLGAMKYSGSSQEHNITDDSNQAMAYRAMPDATVRDKNSFLYTDPDVPYALPISVLPEGGIYQRRDFRMYGYDFRASATWNKIFDNKHITNFYVGTELNTTDRKRTWFNGWGLQYSLGEIPFYTYQFFKKGIEGNSSYYTTSTTRYRSAAFFATGSYSYEGRYTANVTGRYEGTNKLGKSRSARWLPTWNVSGAWNVHEEKFFEDIKQVLSHLSFRTSYSLTGDRGPSFVTNSTAILKSYNPYRPFAGDKESGIQLDDLENSELTYEKKHEFNLGFDAGFLNNRLNFTFDIYWRNNFDLIGMVNTEGIGGQLIKYANMAEMKGSGQEFSISSKNIVGKNFSWNTDLIFGHNTTEITKLKSQSRVIDLITTTSGANFAVGSPNRALYSIPFVRLNEEGLPVFIGSDGQETTSDIYFQERDKVDFLKYEGSADPTITGSLGNVFRYKGFSMNVFVTYSFGNKIRLDPVFNYSYSDLVSTPKEFKNRWTLPGDENYTNIPVIISHRQYLDNNDLKYAYNAYNYSSARVADGGFIRMKEISLNYDFPKKWLNSNINNLSLKLQATNLFLIYSDSKLNGQDPEFFRSGGVSAPVPKQFTMTVRLGL